MTNNLPELSLLLLQGGPGFMPKPASSVAGQVDGVFFYILGVSIFFLALIVGLTVFFIVKYRARRWRMDPEPSPTHNGKLEFVWTAIPIVLVMSMFFFASRAWLATAQAAPAEAAMQVHVTARKWSWWFEHPGGKGTNELHLVKDKSAQLVMSADDVLHSLYVPAFRLKQDVVPGRYTKLNVTPIAEGTYPILCAEYCGTNHSQMLSNVVVHADEASYRAWADEKLDESVPLLEVGKKAYEQKGCIACHSLDGSPRLGPSFKGLWQKTETLKDGSTVLVDENYVRESILEPQAKVVPGFAAAMPPMPMSEREIKGVIEFIKSLQ